MISLLDRQMLSLLYSSRLWFRRQRVNRQNERLTSLDEDCMFRYRITAILLMVSLAVSGCSTAKIDLDAHGLSPYASTEVRFFNSRGYDEYGRPGFRGRLEKRPSKKGQKYIAVYYQNGLPVLSYDILIRGRSEKDLEEADEIIGRWGEERSESGAGDEGNDNRQDFGRHLWQTYPYSEVDTVGEALEEEEERKLEAEEDGRGETIGYIIVAVAGFVVGAILGSAKVVFDKLFVHKHEVIFLQAAYEYDQVGRLCLVRLYAPDRAFMVERARLEFYYRVDSAVPYDSEMIPVISNPTALVIE